MTMPVLPIMMLVIIIVTFIFTFIHRDFNHPVTFRIWLFSFFIWILGDLISEIS